MKFTPEFLDEIRQRVPLSSIIAPAVSWDRRKSQRGKGDFWACCPFHGEKTPSFHVEDRKGRYYCFGCHVSGDHFSFLTDHNGMTFPDAVAQVAEMAGVPMPQKEAPADPGIRRRAAARKGLEAAAKLYSQFLADSQGDQARQYADGRGFDREVRREFGFGLSPSSAGVLLRRAEAKGVSAEAMINAGLVLRRDDGSLYERFRGRLMIPIHDRQGRIIGFGGRDLVGREPKYLNSPQTELFDKSSVLFIQHRAQGPAHRANRLFVVEGYMDAIALARCGIGEVVASLGTALTETQLKLAWAMADEPVLCFDGDKAGRAAASRAMDRIVPLLASGKSAQILTLPDGADPDDIVRDGGREAFEALVTRATPLIDALVEREAAKGIATPERIAAMEQRLSGLAASIPDQGLSRIYRDFFRQRAFELRREVTSTSRRAGGPGRDGARQQRPQRIGGATIRPPASADAGMAEVEKIVIGLLILQPNLIESVGETLTADSLLEPITRAALADLHEAYAQTFAQDPLALLAALPRGAERWLGPLWGQRADAGGIALRRRFAVLSSEPSPSYLQRSLTVFVEKLNIRTAARELAEAPARFAAHGGLDDAPLLAMTQALEERRTALADAERVLAEEAAALRRSFLAERVGDAA